jgi:hypothetical protein
MPTPLTEADLDAAILRKQPRTFVGLPGCGGQCDQGRKRCNCATRMPPLRRNTDAAPLDALPPLDDTEHDKGVIGNPAGRRVMRWYLIATACIVLGAAYFSRHH